jgi:hypothetical protein
VRHFVEAHGVAVPVGDDRRTVGRSSQQLTVGLNHEASRSVDRACREIDVRVTHRRRHFVDANGARRKLTRVDVDTDSILL